MVLLITCTLLSIIWTIASSGRKPECQTLAFELLSVPLAISSIQDCKKLCNDKFQELQNSLWFPTQEDVRDQIIALANSNVILDRVQEFRIDTCVRQRRYCIGNSDIWLSISEPVAETSSPLQLSVEALRRVRAFTRTCSWEKPDFTREDQTCSSRPFRSCLCRRILVMMVAMVAQPLERQGHTCSHQQICKRLTLRFSSTTFSQWICNRSFFIGEILCSSPIRSCSICVGRDTGNGRVGGPCFDATKLPADLQQGLELNDFALEDLPDTYTISFQEMTNCKRHGQFRMRYRQFYPGHPHLPDKVYHFSGIPSLDDFLSTQEIPNTRADHEVSAHTQALQTHWISFDGGLPRTSSSNVAHIYCAPDSEFQTVSAWPPISKVSRHQGSSSRNLLPILENTLVSPDPAQAAINMEQTVDFLQHFETRLTPDILGTSTNELGLVDFQAIRDDEPSTILSLDDSSFRRVQAEGNPAASTNDKGKRKMHDRDNDDQTVDFFAMQRQRTSLRLDLFASTDIDHSNPFENVAIHGDILQLHLSDTTSARTGPLQDQRTLAQNIHVMSSTTANDHSGAQPGPYFASLSSVVSSGGTPRPPDQPASAEDTEKETLNLFQTIL